MQVYGASYLHGPQPVSPPHSARVAASAAEARPAAGDEVQFSPAAQMLDRLSDVPAVRAERIEQIRAELAAGTYMTDEKLALALDRLLNEIG